MTCSTDTYKNGRHIVESWYLAQCLHSVHTGRFDLVYLSPPTFAIPENPSLEKFKPIEFSLRACITTHSAQPSVAQPAKRNQ